MRARRRRHRIWSLGFGSSGGGPPTAARFLFRAGSVPCHGDGLGSCTGGTPAGSARFFCSTLSSQCLTRQQHGPSLFRLWSRSVLADGSDIVANSPAGVLRTPGGAFVRLARNCYSDRSARPRRALGDRAGTGRRNREALSTVRDAGEILSRGKRCRSKASLISAEWRGSARERRGSSGSSPDRRNPLFVRMAPGLRQPGSADASGYPGNLAGSLPAVVALLALIYGAGCPTPIGIDLARP